ncbi:hypothetical protein EMIT048CA2_50108 [Pseudomonas chlororaphis]
MLYENSSFYEKIHLPGLVSLEFLCCLAKWRKKVLETGNKLLTLCVSP